LLGRAWCGAESARGFVDKERSQKGVCIFLASTAGRSAPIRARGNPATLGHPPSLCFFGRATEDF
jgi:hypothetical protein